MTVREDNGKSQKFSFNKLIISTVSDPISTKELINRVRTLSNELAAFHQEHVEIPIFNSLKKDLVNKKLLRHANTGVQAYVCCSIADILRLCAPDAPFTAGELSSIFKAFFQQFKNLGDQENPYFEQQCYLLKKLAEVRSVILITDLPDSQELIESLFDVFYNLASKDIPSRLEPVISDILSEVISESETVPHNVLKVILNEFLSNASQGPITSGVKLHSNNLGLTISIKVCESNLDRMSRLLAQFFSEILYENTTDVEQVDAVANGNSGLNHENIKRMKALENLKKVHKLSIQIWELLPELLNSVLGLIDDELNADDESIRILATDTIGRMIGLSFSNTSRSIFSISHKATWFNWLKKTLDMSPIVRCKWVEQLSVIVTDSYSASDMSSELASGLTKCLLDTEERVRLTSCICISKIPLGCFISKICTKSVLLTLTRLVREKSPEIRNEIIKILGNLYNHYEEAKLNNTVIDYGPKNDDDIKDFEKIIAQDAPNSIISLLYINDRNINAVVDFCIFEKLIPFESNHTRRVIRILRLFSALDNKSRKAFLAISRRQHQLARIVEKYVDAGEAYAANGSININDSNERNNSDNSDSQMLNNSDFNKNTITMTLDKTISWLAESFPDGLNTHTCLERFFKVKNFRFFHLVKICISPDSDYLTVKNSMKELLHKLTNVKNIRIEEERTNVSTTDMVSNLKILLYRSSILLYNKSNVSELLYYSKQFTHEWSSVSNEILIKLSAVVPQVLKYHIDEMIGIDFAVNQADFLFCTQRLKLLYQFFKKCPEMYPSEDSFTDCLKSLCLNSSPGQAKYSVRILSCSNNKEILFGELIDSLFPLNTKDEKLATRLSLVAEMFLLSNEQVENYASEITVFLIKELLLRNREGADLEEENEEWIGNVDLERYYEKHVFLYEKLLALRIFTNRIRAFEDSDALRNTEKNQASEPVFKLFSSIIGNGGEIIKQGSDSSSTTPKVQLMLRFAAGVNFLKLARCPLCNDRFDSFTLGRLIFLLQDLNVRLRREFLTKLQKYLSNESISVRFWPLVFFMAHEPDANLKEECSTWIKSMASRQENKKDMKLERSLVRLIHIIAHSEEFIQPIKRAKELQDEAASNEVMKGYVYALRILLFYVDCIAKAENISLLYYLASRVKQYRDAMVNQEFYTHEELPQEAINIYCISELAQLVLKELCDHRNWPLQTWPGKIQLSLDLFASMTSTKEAHEIITRVYIPEYLQLKIKGTFKQRFSPHGNAKRKPQTKANTSKKAKAIRSSSTKKKNQKRLSNHPEEGFEPTRKSGRSKNRVNYAENGSESEASESEESDYSN